jgi:hypothetical protein
VRDAKVGRERLWQLEAGQIEEARCTLEVIGNRWTSRWASTRRLQNFPEWGDAAGIGYSSELLESILALSIGDVPRC